MRLKYLHLENIGPFIEADLEFIPEGETTAPVTLITGENGTGKSILLEAIRGMFGRHYGMLVRDLRRRTAKQDSQIQIRLDFEDEGLIFQEDYELQSVKILSDQITTQNVKDGSNRLASIPLQVEHGGKCPNWIVDYWPSITSTGTYTVNNLKSPDHKAVFKNSLTANRTKSDVTQLICHFDYLRSSEDPAEREIGQRLYELMGYFISHSLLEGGYFSHVARSTYEPVVVQNGVQVGLANLSSGNSYLIQSLIGLLGKMYSLAQLRGDDSSELTNIPGLLLIDEAENQLHPKWQKRLIPMILEFFPNLQIIAATHSPFIISSVENARLFVCKSEVDHCVVVDESAQYSNRPIDEILMSPLFGETQPFNQEISALLENRRSAIAQGNQKERLRIEAKLKNLNPTYFAFLDLEKLMTTVLNGKGQQ